MSQSISAPAISRILNTAGFKKAHNSGWSTGYIVTSYGVQVEITYQETDPETQAEILTQIAEKLNGREGQKYYATKRFNPDSKTEHVKVVVRDESSPHQNADRKAEALEKLAEQRPYAPVLKDVKTALRVYDKDGYSESRHGGWVAVRDHEDSRLVRVTYRETPFTTYEIDRDTQVLATLRAYVTVLRKAGFSTKLIEDEWAVLVGTDGEFPGEAEKAKAALLVLREEVEKELGISTRRAGDHSIFVIRQLSFKDRSTRLEVFYAEGEYKSAGRFGMGGMKHRSSSAAEMAAWVITEMPDSV